MISNSNHTLLTIFMCKKLKRMVSSPKQFLRILIFLFFVVVGIFVWESSFEDKVRIFSNGNFRNSLQDLARLRNLSFETLKITDFEKIPVETLNPNGEFFGLRYKNTYGLPVGEDKSYDNFFEEFTKDLPGWETFFPKLKVSIQQYKLHNPHAYDKAFTSNLSYVIFEEEKSYKVGDIFVAKIQAKDFLNRNKPFGGDYFRVRLMKVGLDDGEALSDGIPCAVEDHLDGTYSIYAPLPVPGMYKLEVLLGASIEAISSYIDWADGRTHDGMIFNATLLSNESAECNSDLLLYDKYQGQKVCDYTNPRNGEPYFCSRPPSGVCFPIRFLSPYFTPVVDSLVLNKPFNIRIKLENSFQWCTHIVGTGHLINILSNEATNNSKVIKMFSQLFQNSSLPLPSGFSHKGRWVSFANDYENDDIKKWTKCFSNKLVYMLGDSTMRQFFDLLQPIVHLNVSVTHQSKYYHVPRTGVNHEHNITIYYRAHGPPIRNPGPPSISPYISDTIDTIKVGGKDVVLIINIGLHYVEYNPAIFIHRLRGIKQALIRHIGKFPRTRIIIKGMNVSTLKFLPFEWLIWRYNVILKKFFADIKNSVFIDLWDMTTLWPLTKDYHPLEATLKEQAFLIFSYFC